MLSMAAAGCRISVNNMSAVSAEGDSNRHGCFLCQGPPFPVWGTSRKNPVGRKLLRSSEGQLHKCDQDNLSCSQHLLLLSH